MSRTIRPPRTPQPSSMGQGPGARGGLARGLPLGLLAGALGCAPTTLSPHIIRMDSGVPGRSTRAVGLRTGPRLSSATAAPTGSGTFSGDLNSFNLVQWGLAYDLALSHALTPRDSLHFGAQAEFAVPFPLPGYGLYAGFSHLEELGRFRLVPAVCVHGATDLGLGVVGGPGTQGGLELSTTLAYRPTPTVALALVPFMGVHAVLSGPPGRGAGGGTSLYAGGVLALQFDAGEGRTGLELSGGFGRVVSPGVPSWNVPLAGVRATQ